MALAQVQLFSVIPTFIDCVLSDLRVFIRHKRNKPRYSKLNYQKISRKSKNSPKHRLESIRAFIVDLHCGTILIEGLQVVQERR